MILLAISSTQLIIIFLLGLFMVLLLGYTILHFAKIRVEKDLDSISIESSKRKELSDEPIVKKINLIDNIKESAADGIDSEEVKKETKDNNKSETKHLSEIEIVLAKMQTDLNKDEEEGVNSFEEEQEEKSIISYQELKAMKDKIVLYEDELEANTDYALPTVEKMLEIKESPKEELEIKKFPREEMLEKSDYQPERNGSSFSGSEIISPIYGRMESKKLDYPSIHSFKNEIDIAIDDSEEKTYEPILVDYEEEIQLTPFNKVVNEDIKSSSEINDTKKGQEFLNELKSFRENL